jgi:hypothetical protein
MQELLDTLDGWRAEGAGVGRAVVVRTFGSAPRRGAVPLDRRRAAAGSVSGARRGRCRRGDLGDAQERPSASSATGSATSRRAVGLGLRPSALIPGCRTSRHRRQETREGRGDGRAIVTPLPADAPRRRSRPPPGIGAEPLRSRSTRTRARWGSPTRPRRRARDALRTACRGRRISGRQPFIEAFRSVRPVVVGASGPRTLVRLAKGC